MTTRYDPDRHHRRSIRLPEYDYGQAGAYFVTICTQGRECVLDDPVVRGIIQDVWQALPERFATIALDAFVVMPNHVHLIVWLHPSDEDQRAAADQRAEGSDGDVGATLAVAPTVAPMADTGGSDGDVGGLDGDVAATLAVAPTAVAPTADTAWQDWIIPKAQKVKENPTLGDLMGVVKSLVFTVYLDWIERHDPTRRAKFWQRNYYEHVIRNERELKAIRQYITDNPDRWAQDTYNPAAGGPDPSAVDLWRLLQEGAE